MGPGCRSERGARAEAGELHRFREKVGRARDGERVRQTVHAAGLSERTESGKGREWERAGPRCAGLLAASRWATAAFWAEPGKERMGREWEKEAGRAGLFLGLGWVAIWVLGLAGFWIFLILFYFYFLFYF